MSCPIGMSPQKKKRRRRSAHPHNPDSDQLHLNLTHGANATSRNSSEKACLHARRPNEILPDVERCSCAKSASQRCSKATPHSSFKQTSTGAIVVTAITMIGLLKTTLCPTIINYWTRCFLKATILVKRPLVLSHCFFKQKSASILVF